MASTPLVVHPRRAHLHCARPTRDLPGLGLTVADHQPPPARVASLLVGVHILGHLDLQGCHQHPPSTLPGQVVQRRSRGRFFRFRCRVEYLQHGWRLLSPACQPASHVDYAKGYAAFFTLPIHNFGLYLLPPLPSCTPGGVVARIVTSPHDANRQDPHRPMRYDTGRPRAVIRLRISQPRTTSLSHAAPPAEGLHATTPQRGAAEEGTWRAHARPVRQAAGRGTQYSHHRTLNRSAT